MSYTCKTCGMTSHNPHDEVNRYCGNCHQFEDDAKPFASVALQRIIDEVRVEKEAGVVGYNRVYHRHNR